MKNFARFEVKCDLIGFSVMHEIPIDCRGYVHKLAEDLERAFLFYKLQIENHELKSSADTSQEKP